MNVFSRTRPRCASALALLALIAMLATSVAAQVVYEDGLSPLATDPAVPLVLGDFRPDLSVQGRQAGSLGNAAGDNLDGARVYIYDFLDTTFSQYAMMVFEMDQPYDGVRLYTHQDHYGGGPVTTSFVGQDLMEYSVWGSNAAEPTQLSDWELLSDVVDFDLNGAGPGVPTYTFAGLDGGEPSVVYRGGSTEFGIVNAYTREYQFSQAYKWFGFRSSTISILEPDADPELDAIGGFFRETRECATDLVLVDFHTLSWDPGTLIWEVEVGVRNNGPDTALGVNVTLMEEIAWVTPVDGTSSHGDIAAGETKYGDSFTLDLTGRPGPGGFNVFFNVSYTDECGDTQDVVLDPEANVPEAKGPFALDQNSPNPFNPATSIAFELASPGNVRLDVFDVRGRLVTTLVDEERSASRYVEVWDGTDTTGRRVGSGTYYYRLTAGQVVETRKMVLSK